MAVFSSHQILYKWHVVFHWKSKGLPNEKECANKMHAVKSHKNDNIYKKLPVWIMTMDKILLTGLYYERVTHVTCHKPSRPRETWRCRRAGPLSASSALRTSGIWLEWYFCPLPCPLWNFQIIVQRYDKQFMYLYVSYQVVFSLIHFNKQLFYSRESWPSGRHNSNTYFNQSNWIWGCDEEKEISLNRTDPGQQF